VMDRTTGNYLPHGYDPAILDRYFAL